jgi:hypothetical protein
VLFQVFENGRSVERSNLRVPVEGTTRRIPLTVKPVGGLQATYEHIRFEDARRSADEGDERAGDDADAGDEHPPETRREAELRQELEQTREQL